MRGRVCNKVWNRMADGFMHRERTILRAQIKGGLKGKNGRWLDDLEDAEDYDGCPVCGTGGRCTCNGTGVPGYGQVDSGVLMWA